MLAELATHAQNRPAAFGLPNLEGWINDGSTPSPPSRARARHLRSQAIVLPSTFKAMNVRLVPGGKWLQQSVEGNAAKKSGAWPRGWLGCFIGQDMCMRKVCVLSHRETCQRPLEEGHRPGHLLFGVSPCGFVCTHFWDSLLLRPAERVMLPEVKTGIRRSQQMNTFLTASIIPRCTVRMLFGIRSWTFVFIDGRFRWWESQRRGVESRSFRHGHP